MISKGEINDLMSPKPVVPLPQFGELLSVKAEQSEEAVRER